MLPAHATTPATINGASELLQRESDRGIVSVPDLGRVALFSATAVRELHRAILEVHPETAPDVLYRIGFEWALESMVSFSAHRPEAAAREIASPALLLLDWWEGFRKTGWGALARAEVVAPGMALMDLDQGAVGPALGRSDDPVCHLYAGLFAGALSFLAKSECHGVEVQCRATGADICRFVIGPANTVDQVETWRQQGVSPAQIVDRVIATLTGNRPMSGSSAHGAPALILCDSDGARVVGGSQEMLRSLRFVLESEKCGNWSSVLALAGRNLGRAIGAQQEAALRQSRGVAPAHQPLRESLRALSSRFSEYGWGVLAADAPGAEGYAFVVVSLAGSPLAGMPSEAGASSDPIARGVLVGFIESVTGNVLASAEIGGCDSCTYVLSSAERLATVAPFIGREPVDRIIARLRS